MKATEILKALCREELDLEDCHVFTTDDSPWNYLSWLFHHGSSEGEVQSFTTYFCYWSTGPGNKYLERCDKPDIILYLRESETKVYVWKIE